MAALEPYEIYAVKYAEHERRASENFLGGDPHDGPMPLDYFVWAVVGPQKSYLVDTGFDATVARKRNRPLLRTPAEGLAMAGVDLGRVSDVIVTHMHYDHCGNHDLLPEATYHLQELEMSYATGRHMCHGPLRYAYEAEDVCAMVRRLFKGRLLFRARNDELAPGLTLHHVGGHTMGLQAVRVWTKRGWVVLASDVSHFYANMEEERPFPHHLQHRRRARRLQDAEIARELAEPHRPRPRSPCSFSATRRRATASRASPSASTSSRLPDIAGSSH